MRATISNFTSPDGEAVPNPPIECWIVTDGRAGMVNQCLGLAHALGVEATLKRLVPRAPWRYLPPQLWLTPLRALSDEGDRLGPPWPDLAIGSGRVAVAPMLALKRANPRTVTVQIQNPTVAPSGFDLVIAPQHDGLGGPHVLSTLGAIHGVSDDRLAEAELTFRARYAALPRPVTGVLIGGANRQYRLTAEDAARLGRQLAQAAKQTGGGLAITPSRRTDPDRVRQIVAELGETPADIWNGTGDNPYFGILAVSDALVVTCDSVNMVSEACATRKPVHVFRLTGGSAKFSRFHAACAERGMTRPFEGRIERWSYDPPDDVGRAAAAVRRLVNEQRGTRP